MSMSTEEEIEPTVEETQDHESSNEAQDDEDIAQDNEEKFQEDEKGQDEEIEEDDKDEVIVTMETSGFSSQQKGPISPSKCYTRRQVAQFAAKIYANAESSKLEKCCSKERKEESVKLATSDKKEVVSFPTPSLQEIQNVASLPQEGENLPQSSQGHTHEERISPKKPLQTMLEENIVELTVLERVLRAKNATLRESNLRMQNEIEQLRQEINEYKTQVPTKTDHSLDQLAITTAT